MKKILALLLAVLLLSSTAAFADTDLKTMSNDALLELYEAVRSEMRERGLTPTMSLRDGKYIVGQDIDAGTYLITCTGTEGESLGDAYSSLGSAYGSLLGDDWNQLMGAAGSMLGAVSEMKVEIVGDYGSVLKSFTMKTGDTATITLSEGTALSISEGSCTVEAK